MVSKDLYIRYQFFRENAGYCVGSRAAGALALARAEIWFEENEGIANWLWDDEPWDGDVPAPTEVLGCIVTVDGETTSLWGIGDPDESCGSVWWKRLGILS